MGQKIRLFALTAILIFSIFIAGCITGQSPGGGTLQLSSVPVGAEVYLDNQYHGSTPCTIADVTAGNHTLEFRHDGYENWLVTIAVSQETYQLNATLTPLSQPASQPTSMMSTPVSTLVPTSAPTQAATISPTTVTIQSDRSTMTIGMTLTFSGTCTGTGNVILVLYGPGLYTNGVTIDKPPINSFGAWTYTWNPGYRILGGTYTMIVYDPLNTTSAHTGFAVLGSGTVVGSAGGSGSGTTASSITIAESTTKVSASNYITFSGFCPTGSTNVILTLYGPGQYSQGIVVSTPSVNANQIWSYTWTAPGSVTANQIGTYTMTVQDAERTQSASVQFILNS
jgi:hypothetical protein